MIIEVYIHKSQFLEKQLAIAKNSFFDISEVIILPADITYTKADCILYSGNTNGDMNDTTGILLKTFLSSCSDIENKIKYVVQCRNFGELLLNSSTVVKLQHPTVRYLIYTAFNSSKEVSKSSIRSYSCFRSALLLAIQYKMQLIAITLYQTNDLKDFETNCIQLRDAILSLKHILRSANKYTLCELYELNTINEYV